MKIKEGGTPSMSMEASDLRCVLQPMLWRTIKIPFYPIFVPFFGITNDLLNMKITYNGKKLFLLTALVGHETTTLGYSLTNRATDAWMLHIPTSTRTLPQMTFIYEIFNWLEHRSTNAQVVGSYSTKGVSKNIPFFVLCNFQVQ